MKANSLLRVTGILSFCFLLLCKAADAQEDCGTAASSSQLSFETNRLQEGWEYADNPVYQFAINIPVQFHILRQSNGTGGFSPTNIPTVLSQLNAAYNAIGNAGWVFYEKATVRFIDNSTLFTSALDGTLRNSLASANNQTNCINLYYVPSLVGGLAGVTSDFDADPDWVFVSTNGVSSIATLAHEVGHYFNLLHTYQVVGGVFECPDGSNCLSAGDFICDTPADHLWTAANVGGNCAYLSPPPSPSNCNPAIPYAPDPTNFMRSGQQGGCRTSFSQKQEDKMYFALVNKRRELLPGGVSINVPGQYATIQSAIDAAQPCDTIVVLPGVWTGVGNRSLSLQGKPVVVRAQNPNPNQTIIDLQYSSEPAFIFNSNETNMSVVSGFTIRNVDNDAANGGAIRILNASPTIENCIFSGCRAQNGGAIHYNSAYQTKPLISNCRFELCTAANASVTAGNGGSIWFGSKVKPVIENCVFNNNYAEGFGGAIYGAEATDVVDTIKIRNCEFSNQAVGVSGDGVALYLSGKVELTQLTIARNNGGNTLNSLVYFVGATSTQTIDRVLFSDNGSCYALRTSNVSSGTNILRSHFWQNAPGNIHPSSSFTATIPSGTLTSGDPLYCNAAAYDFGLSWLSPCEKINLTSYPSSIGRYDATCGPAPSLTSPAAGATVDTNRPTLDWADVNKGNGTTLTYETVLDNSADCLTPERTFAGLTTSQKYVQPGVVNGNWYWRSRAKNTIGSPPRLVTGQWSPIRSVAVQSCCVGKVGNVDGDPDDVFDIGDLTIMVDHLFISFSPVACFPEGNFEQTEDGVLDIADLGLMVDYLFTSLNLEPACYQ